MSLFAEEEDLFLSFFGAMLAHKLSETFEISHKASQVNTQSYSSHVDPLLRSQFQRRCRRFSGRQSTEVQGYQTQMKYMFKEILSVRALVEHKQK